MEKIQFKTNINCDACVAKVTPVLNANTAVTQWEVDTKNPAKILTVEGDGVAVDELVASLNKIGYRAEQLS